MIFRTLPFGTAIRRGIQYIIVLCCKDRNNISNLQTFQQKIMANAQNIDKIFAELAKRCKERCK